MWLRSFHTRLKYDPWTVLKVSVGVTVNAKWARAYSYAFSYAIIAECSCNMA